MRRFPVSTLFHRGRYFTYATLFDIQRFSVHDGPGIRTTVFFKGCNLRCFWCHNPESVNPGREVQFLEQKCIMCGKCAAVCTKGCHTMEDGRRCYDRTFCVACGECTFVCPSEALAFVGKNDTVQEVLEVVARDAPFFKNSGGGITCSGGEPMLQIDFLQGLLSGARTLGLHTAVDTAGNVPFRFFQRVFPVTDLFLYDIKCIDDDTHIKATGTSNRLILENIKRLSEAGAAVWVRIPVVPGVSNTVDNMVRTADLLQALHGIERVELLNFHRLGGGKYESLGKTYAAQDLVPATKEEMTALSAPFIDRNMTVKVS
jgi:pyruvate formate lyase activating enzyme